MVKELNKELKAKYEEPTPKRGRLSETLILGEETWSPSWDRLPHDITVQVYSYLKDSDRGAMARVCQAWYKSFKDPSLWRSREFNLGGPDGDKMIQFASIFGIYLKDVVIRCPKRTLDTYKNIPEVMENLVKKLEKARLCRLELLDMESYFRAKPKKFKDTLARCLRKILKSQTALKHVVLMNCHLYDRPGTKVLSVLQESCGQTVESLQLIQLFPGMRYLKEDPLKKKYELRFTHDNKFTNLREIKCHYSYVSEEIILGWAEDLKDKLERMTLYVLEHELKHSPVITSTTWRNLAKACPQLKVDLHISSIFTETKIIQILAPGMPLNGFSVKSRMRTELNLKVSSILTHLAENFDQELESFKLELLYIGDWVDDEIIHVVKKCRKLTEIRVPASAALRVATALFNDFGERQVLNVQLSKGFAKDRRTLQSYKTLVKRFHDILSNIQNLKVELVDDE